MKTSLFCMFSTVHQLISQRPTLRRPGAATYHYRSHHTQALVTLMSRYHWLQKLPPKMRLTTFERELVSWRAEFFKARLTQSE
jgi:hypothetical protein